MLSSWSSPTNRIWVSWQSQKLLKSWDYTHLEENGTSKAHVPLLETDCMMVWTGWPRLSERRSDFIKLINIQLFIVYLFCYSIFCFAPDYSNFQQVALFKFYLPTIILVFLIRLVFLFLSFTPVSRFLQFSLSPAASTSLFDDFQFIIIISIISIHPPSFSKLLWAFFLTFFVYLSYFSISYYSYHFLMLYFINRFLKSLMWLNYLLIFITIIVLK